MFFHAVKDVKELKEPVEAADDLDLEETLFIKFLIRFTVKVFSSLVNHIDQLL